MSKIEWTQETWNFIVGCTMVSPGCQNCYAMRMAWRLMHNQATADKYAETARKTEGGKIQWTGKINIDEDRLTYPLTVKKPTIFFVNSMSDLFHEDVPFVTIDRAFDYMNAADWHTFQVLTKRADIMLKWFKWKEAGNGFKFEEWPLQNVWIGVTAENQQAADERIPLLLQVSAAVRFVSCEPLLGEIDFEKVPTSSLQGKDNVFRKINYIDWVIAGGESGPNARPMHPDWVKQIRNQCKAAGIPFFFKQWGEWAPIHELSCNKPGIKGKQWFNFDPETSVCRVGKKMAGRLLDGIIYNEFPKSVV